MAEPSNDDGRNGAGRTESDETLRAKLESGPAEDEDFESVDEELAATRGKLVRLQADMENYRKRVDRTILDIVRSRRADVMRAMLPVLDSLDRAIDSVDPEAAETAGLLEGVRLTRKQMADALKAQGVAPIEANGKFDPAYHEVVATVADSDRNDGEIVDVIRTGYLFDDLVLRPASVRVAKNQSDDGAGVDLEA